MFAAQAGELLGNRAFVVKMGLVAAAGINAALFHARGGAAAARRDRARADRAVAGAVAGGHHLRALDRLSVNGG